MKKVFIGLAGVLLIVVVGFFCMMSNSYHIVRVGNKTSFVDLDRYEKLQKGYLSDKSFSVKEDGDEIFIFDLLDIVGVSIDKDSLQKETNSSLLSYIKNITLQKDYLVWTAQIDLKEYEDNISILNKTRSKSRDAEIVKDSGWFVIKEEEIGTQIDSELLLQEILKCLGKNKFDIDIKDCDVYKKPEVTSDDLKSNLDELNKFKDLSINYTSGDSITSNDFFKYMSYNDGEIDFDFSFLSDIIDKLDSYYTTVGINREFKTTKGDKVEVSGGTYGNIMNKSAELKYLKKQIKRGTSISDRTPKLSNTVSFGDGYNDLGDCYIEINLADQHLWYYKDGVLFSESNVVTGRAGVHDTPRGVYKITEHLRNTVLRGTGYATRVSYWMRLNPQGIGLHDATWRGTFGGSIYKTNGSHGCINLPISFARELFENTENYIPVVIY